MNKVYRVVWNEIKGVWQAVCEVATGHAKRTQSSRRQRRREQRSHAHESLQASPNAPDPVRTLRNNMPLALEPRMLFDAAGVVTALDAGQAVDEPGALYQTQPDDPLLHEALMPLAPAAVSPLDALVQNPANEVVFIDSAVEQYQALLDAAGPGVEVVLIDANQDGLQQIADYLAGRSDIDAIHILGHGTEGEQQIGSSVLNSATLASQGVLLAQIGGALSADGDILLYGCQVAADGGQVFVNQLASMTGADVAASTDATGNAAAGGDWTLEYQSGKVESASFFDGVSVAGFDGVLVAATITDPLTQTIAEGASLSFSGLVTVAGGDSEMIAEVLITGGTGQLSDANLTVGTSLSVIGDLTAVQTYLNGLTYTPSTDSNETATIVIRVDENSAQSSATSTVWNDYTTLTVNITPVPDRPTLSAVATLTAVAEDTAEPTGASISSLFGSQFADIDSNTLAGLAISGNAGGSAGVWEYQVTSGAWTAVGSVSSTHALLLDASTLLRFKPAANYNGTPGSLTVRAIDSSTSQSFSSTSAASYATALTGTDTSATDRTLQTSITAVNDAPTSSDFSATVAKNVILTDINLTTHATDVDVADQIASYKITALPDALAGVLQKSTGVALSVGSTLTVSEAQTLKFVPATNYTGSPSFSFTATDTAGLESNASTVTITVQTFNEPPVVTVPGTLSVAEDASSGLTISGISVADLDAGSSTVEATVSTNHGGTITLSTITDLSFQGGTTNGTATVTVQGTLTAINTALNGLLYHSYQDFNGSETITVTVNDLAATDPKSDTESFNVTVTPVADKPVLSGSATLAAVNEDTTNPAGATVSSLVTSSIYSDVDGNTLAGIAISANAASSSDGAWQYSVNDGVSWVDVGSVSTNSALLLSASAKLRFVPTANWSGTPGALTIHAIDNSGSRTYTSASPVTMNVSTDTGSDFSGAQSLGTSVTAVNDLFVVVNDKSLTVNEGGTVTLGTSTLQVTDVEADAANIVYTITLLPTTAGTLQKSGVALALNGTFTQDDINNNRITFVHNGDEPTATGTSLSIGYSVTDVVSGLGTSSNRTLTINVSPINDTPTLTVTPGTVTIGQTLAITGSIFSVTDPDNTKAQLVFRIASLPSAGSLTINGAPAAVGSTFSYADVLAGNVVTYTNNGGTATSDSFSVSLRDGAGGGGRRNDSHRCCAHHWWTQHGAHHQRQSG